MQRIATELRPSVLDALGLDAAIRDEARRFALRSGIAVGVDAEPGAASGPLMPTDVATALFRIFQEILTNVARHSRSTSVRVVLGRDPRGWLLQVRDDGVGFAEEEEMRSDSLGTARHATNAPNSSTDRSRSIPHRALERASPVRVPLGSGTRARP